MPAKKQTNKTMTNSLSSIFFSLCVAKDCFSGSALGVCFPTGTLVATDVNQKTLFTSLEGLSLAVTEFLYIRN